MNLWKRPNGQEVLRHAAKYLVESNDFGYHVHPYEDAEYYLGDCGGIVTAKERPIFDALHILACASRGRDRSLINVTDTVAWLLDEAEDQHMGAKGASGNRF